ncbi:MAG TPA: hypothetical protein PLL08_07015 [Bacteroidales bacterium]|nr:hypothetical protein [Bacteroidales bacterium]
MPRSLTLTGRSSVPSPRAQAVGTRRQKELLKSLFPDFVIAYPKTFHQIKVL